jgi:hypothetical protein
MMKSITLLMLVCCCAIAFAKATTDTNKPMLGAATPGIKSIQLKSFSGNYDYNANTVNLTWETLAEENTHFMVLQRSEDAENFEDLCIIKAAGNTAGVSAYNCADVKPMKGMSYYRIKQINDNKVEVFSDIMSMNVVFPDNEEATYIIPNPNDGMFRLLVPSSHEEVEIQIMDEMGQLIKMLSITNNEPNFYMSLDLRNVLAKGSYYVMIDVAHAQHVKKMRVVNSW